MEPDRRRLLVAAASGLGTLLVPGISNACCFRRRRCARTGLIYPTIFYSTMQCPPNFGWSPDCTVPSTRISQYTGYAFTVSGTGLVAWQQAGNSFICGVKDYTYPVNWLTSTTPAPNAVDGSPYDVLTFYASETGSKSNTTSNTITITVTLTDGTYTLCGGTWPNQTLTYA